VDSALRWPPNSFSPGRQSLSRLSLPVDILISCSPIYTNSQEDLISTLFGISVRNHGASYSMQFSYLIAALAAFVAVDAHAHNTLRKRDRHVPRDVAPRSQ
jgi:hypothetical protein